MPRSVPAEISGRALVAVAMKAPSRRTSSALAGPSAEVDKHDNAQQDGERGKDGEQVRGEVVVEETSADLLAGGRLTHWAGSRRLVQGTKHAQDHQEAAH